MPSDSGKHDSFNKTDQKRQQSQKAAKSRRLTESDVFAELEKLIPNIDQPTVYQVDRITVLRLISVLCRLRRIGESAFSSNTHDHHLKPQGFVSNEAKTLLHDITSETNITQGIDGFFMIVNKVGQLLFVSNSVDDYIGFSQLDLIGRYFRDYVHVDDWQYVREQLRNANNRSKNSKKIFFRMKTALTRRGGRAKKLTLSVYEPLQAFIVKPTAKTSDLSFEGYDFAGKMNQSAKADEDVRFIYCEPFSLSPTRKSTLSRSSLILSRHDLNMRFKTCDDRFASALGYGNAKSIIGQSLFEMIHPSDIKDFSKTYSEMSKNSHSTTNYYRLLNPLTEEYIWTITELMLLEQNVRGVCQKSVVCAHQFLSECLPYDKIHHHLKVSQNQMITARPDSSSITALNQGPSNRKRSHSMHSSSLEQLQEMRARLAKQERQNRMDSKTVESFLNLSDEASNRETQRPIVTMDDFYVCDIYRNRQQNAQWRNNDINF